jgi:hypothetical protein
MTHMNHTEKLVFNRTVRYMRAIQRIFNSEGASAVVNPKYSEIFNRLTDCNDWLRQRRIDPPTWYKSWTISYNNTTNVLTLNGPL